ncbi:putative aliphatic sulfonates transport permease protein SsuC [compost metagenome]
MALPAAAPPILTGLRISLTRAWVVLVAAELLAADSGLGQMIEMSRQMLRIDVVMVGVVMAGLVGFALDFLFRLLERHLFRWKAR